jgi:hypothetical protein
MLNELKKKFEVGDKVKIKKSDEDLLFIGGIYNHMTEEAIKIYFGIAFIGLNTCWKEELTGEIYLVGKENHYIIKNESIKADEYYIFCNDYEEMELI